MLRCTMTKIGYFILGFLLLMAIPKDSFSADDAVKESSLDIPANIEADLKIRVSLGSDRAQVFIATDTPYRVFDGKEHLLFRGSKIVQARVSALDGSVQFGRQSFKTQPIILDSQKSILRLDKRTYRDVLEFSLAANHKLQIVNELDLEDYLRGVLPSETNPNWKENALKAQAVVSRTYALFKMIENRGESFAVSSDILSQVYGGVTSEKPSTNLAIEETAGEILVYKGKIFPAFFHSTCGGATTKTENAWPIKPHPALRGGSCGFCNESQHYRWKANFTENELIAALKKTGRPVTAIRKFDAEDIDESGRPRFFVIEHPAGKIKIPANDFRLAVSPMKMKSVFIQRIVRDGDIFQFVGRGWGHGVGMCQYGDKKMAELGYNYRQILDYYFPGSEILRLKLPEEKA